MLLGEVVLMQGALQWHFLLVYVGTKRQDTDDKNQVITPFVLQYKPQLHFLFFSMHLPKETPEEEELDLRITGELLGSSPVWLSSAVTMETGSFHSRKISASRIRSLHLSQITSG